jgi:hypothetical protein
MQIDNSTAVNSGGNMTVHGVVGGNGNQVTVTHTTPSGSAADELLRLLTAIRAAAAGTDLPIGVRQHVLDATAEAEYRVSTGELLYAGTVLRRTRAELDAVHPARAGSADVLCLLLDNALALVGD